MFHHVLGIICDTIQFGIDNAVYNIYPESLSYRATVCWGVSYTLSIVVRHFFHRFVVFGEYEGTYGASLIRTYATYSSSIVISVVSNYIIVDVFKVPHVVAWIITMLWTGIYNYFMLKATWKGKKTLAEDNVRDSSILHSAEDGLGLGSMNGRMKSPR